MYVECLWLAFEYYLWLLIISIYWALYLILYIEMRLGSSVTLELLLGRVSHRHWYMDYTSPLQVIGKGPCWPLYVCTSCVRAFKFLHFLFWFSYIIVVQCLIIIDKHCYVDIRYVLFFCKSYLLYVCKLYVRSFCSIYCIMCLP